MRKFEMFNLFKNYLSLEKPNAKKQNELSYLRDKLNYLKKYHYQHHDYHHHAHLY